MQWRSSCCLQTTLICLRVHMCVLNAFMPTLCPKVHWTVHAMAQQLLSTDHSSVCAYVYLECIHAYFVPGGALDRACNGAAAAVYRPLFCVCVCVF